MMQTEQDELKAIAAGDVEAFERIFFRYHPRLLYFLTGLTQDEEVSRDMAQDLFLSLWNDRKKLQQVQSFSSYLYRMARYTVYDYFDHLAVCEKYTSDYLLQPIESDSEEEVLFLKELQAAIDQAVAGMSPQRQRIYRMSREEGFSNDEIALKLDLNKRTVENHLSAALSILRKVVYLICISTPFE